MKPPRVIGRALSEAFVFWSCIKMALVFELQRRNGADELNFGKYCWSKICQRILGGMTKLLASPDCRS
jgi:hypothetical protein